MRDRIIQKRPCVIKVIYLALIVILSLMVAGCSSRSSYSITSRSQELPTLGAASYQDSPAVKEDSSGSDVMPKKVSHQWTFDLEVEDSRQANASIIVQTEQLQGYLVKSHIGTRNDVVEANLVVKVPEDKAQSMVEYLEKLGYVKDQAKSSQDVSDAYYDTEARLKVMLAEEDRLLNYLEKTVNIQDLLTVEKEIARVRQERESLQARMNVLKNQVEYTTFTVNISENQLALKAPKGTMGKAGQGFASSLGLLVKFLNGLFIVFITILPFLLLFGGLLYLFLRWLKRRRTKKAAQMQEPTAPLYAPGYKPPDDDAQENQDNR